MSEPMSAGLMGTASDNSELEKKIDNTASMMDKVNLGRRASQANLTPGDLATASPINETSTSAAGKGKKHRKRVGLRK